MKEGLNASRGKCSHRRSPPPPLLTPFGALCHSKDGKLTEHGRHTEEFTTKERDHEGDGWIDDLEARTWSHCHGEGGGGKDIFKDSPQFSRYTKWFSCALCLQFVSNCLFTLDFKLNLFIGPNHNTQTFKFMVSYESINVRWRSFLLSNTRHMSCTRSIGLLKDK